MNVDFQCLASKLRWICQQSGEESRYVEGGTAGGFRGLDWKLCTWFLPTPHLDAKRLENVCECHPEDSMDAGEY